MSYPTSIRLVDVGPRDGLQNEAQDVTAADKIELIKRLTQAGLQTVEAGAFVSPKWVPQMATTAEVLAALDLNTHVAYPVLVPNDKGLDMALAAGVKEIAVFTAASETFNRNNINAGIDESFERLSPVITRALEHKVRVRGYVSCVVGCPYEGQVSPQVVANVTKRLLDLGCYEVSLGDTIGIGTRRLVATMLAEVLKVAPAAKLAAHFHDTYGQALPNLLVALEHGIGVIDTSVGGLGGCPYAPGAGGNVATEDVLYMLDGMGIKTGVDLEKTVAAANWISRKLGREPASKVARALAV